MNQFIQNSMKILIFGYQDTESEPRETDILAETPQLESRFEWNDYTSNIILLGILLNDLSK